MRPLYIYRFVVWAIKGTIGRWGQSFPSDQVCVYNDYLKRSRSSIKKERNKIEKKQEREFRQIEKAKIKKSEKEKKGCKNSRDRENGRKRKKE